MLDNTYISVDDADSYITSSILDNAAWTVASTVARNAAIVCAMIDLDHVYVCNPEQEAEMFADLQAAQCYQAIHLLKQNASDHKQLIAGGVAGVTRSVGPVTESYKYVSGVSRLCSEAALLISKWKSSKEIKRA
jgi:hypothetical protein